MTMARDLSITFTGVRFDNPFLLFGYSAVLGLFYRIFGAELVVAPVFT